MMIQISLRRIESGPDQVAALQRVFEEAPKYSLFVAGQPPDGSEAVSTFSALPPGMGFGDKFVYGIYLKEQLIGCIDLIRGYPDRKTAMLGLLLLSEKLQNQGFGRQVYGLIENKIRNWVGVETIRIGIVRTNETVIPFWMKMGFADTGIRKPFHCVTLESETLVYEKKLTL